MTHVLFQFFSFSDSLVVDGMVEHPQHQSSRKEQHKHMTEFGCEVLREMKDAKMFKRCNFFGVLAKYRNTPKVEVN